MDREVKELNEAIEQIWDIATSKFGLDPFPVRFEIVPATVMYEVGSYALPGRYSHWTFGKAYHRMKMMYDFGLSKIYEVVINSNPSYAFLLETNSPIQNKMVIAHVLGHVDFFKNNAYFSRTNRRMVDEAAMHARRMSEYEFKHGRKVVEEFLDAVLSIEEHIDPNFFIKKGGRDILKDKAEKKSARSEGPYDDLLGDDERGAKEGDGSESDDDSRQKGRLEVPEKDLVYFIMKNSPILEDWQRDTMSMLHEEMEYFVPQMQTKIMNEGWACATGDSLVLTEGGFVRFDELYEAGEKVRVAGGGREALFPITDFHREEKVPTVRIHTRRGLTIEGALKHRVLRADGSWAYLKDVTAGERVAIECGSNIWPERRLPLPFTGSEPSPEDVAAASGVPVSTVARHLTGRNTRGGFGIEAALQQALYRPGLQGKLLSTRKRLTTGGDLDETMAWFLGYYVGDGDVTKSGVCLTTGDRELSAVLLRIIQSSFGLEASAKWDGADAGGRYRIVVHSRELKELLRGVGIDLDDKARSKKVPSLVLRSPKEVVSAFLRGYFDAAAYAGREGVRLSSSSKEVVRAVQIILLNYGILSTQRRHQDDCTQLEITGSSAKLFLEEIGFSLTRKQEALRAYVENHQWFKEEDYTDEVVSTEYGCDDVFDITVGERHAYIANGFVNHNSIWHSRIMREMDLPTHDHLEFAELHSGVVSPHKGQLNPYYLGYKIFEDIEKRWDAPSPEDREKLGRAGGEGREKMFEVREIDNDTSFLRNYLTEELCEELDLFVYELVDEEEWTITEKRWEKVRDQLVANMTNFGHPYIEVLDGDYDGNRELYLRHKYEKVELDMKYARKTLEYVYKLWGRDVHLETVVDDESMVMHYDGKEHDEE
ncbi:MAG TPA: SpoVR family protein [Blastocatellia bacterium]|nr:SpoVR family protein [Blastocatellia bacterium]